MKKRMTAAALVLALACALLTGCSSGKSISEAGLQPMPLSDTDVVLGAGPEFIASSDPGVTDSGVLYLNGGMMRYYDFATKKAYVLCDRPNCRHTGKDCPALYKRDGATGLAQVGDYLYVVKRSEEENAYQLLELGLDGQVQRVLCSLAIGEKEPDSWYIEEIYEVIYTRNTAWITVCWDYIDETGSSSYSTGEGAQIIGVSLTDGAMVTLNEVPEDDSVSYSLAAVSPDYAVVRKSWREPRQPDQETFYEELERGEHPEFEDEEYPYNAYYGWWQKNFKDFYELTVYDLSTGESRLWFSGEELQAYNEEGDRSASTSLHQFMGTAADGRLLYWRYDETFAEKGISDSTGVYVYTWDPATDAVEELIHVENGNVILPNYHGNISASLVDDGTRFYYRMDEANGSKEVYSYNLTTGESTKLFDQPEDITFFLNGVSGDWYMGRKSGESGYYAIPKADYEAGNLDALEEIPNVK